MLQPCRNRKRSVQICNLQTDFGRVTRIYPIRGVQAFKSAPCHPPNAKAEAVATHREKILRFPSWLAGAPKAEVKADVLSRF